MATVPRPWSQEEDNLLRQAVATHGEEPGVWKIIASTIPGRSNKACRKRWLHSLSPTVRKVPWTPAEDALLLELYATHTPPRWSLIAKQIPGRTDDACSKRYREALDPLLKKDSWSEEEDARLLELTSQLGTKWTQVGQAMGRSGLGCRNRWRLLQRKQRSRKNTQEPYVMSYYEHHNEDHDFLETQNPFGTDSALLSVFPPNQSDTSLHDCGNPDSNSHLVSSSFYADRTSQSSLPCDISAMAPLGQVLGFISDTSTPSHNWLPNSSVDSSSLLFPSSHSSLSTPPSSSDESQLHLSASEPSHISHTSQSPDIEYSSPEQVNYAIITEPSENCTVFSPEVSASPRSTRNRHVSKGCPQAKRLSAHLPANTERTILPYACGHPLCWPSTSSHGMSNFATASDLAEHRRLMHGRVNDSDGKEKPFRCALEGCGKGWKNINGIQYHLQISKAHFQNALQKQTLGPLSPDNASSEQLGNQLAVDAIAEPREKGRLYRCPREGCSNSYKQRTGLAYHLAHGHPIDLAQLDVIPPALLRKMSSTGESSVDTR